MKKKLLYSISIAAFILTGGSTISKAQSIASGYYHSLSVCSDGTVRCWGYNVHGELGNAANIDGKLPVQVTSLSNVRTISAGTSHSLALKSDSTVWASGDNTFGEIGDGSYTNAYVPVKLSSLSKVVAIRPGWKHSLALKSDGTVQNWGINLDGELGLGTALPSYSNAPVQVICLTDIVSIASGANHSIALKNDGTVYTLGDNTNGELGNGTKTDSNFPVKVSGLCPVSTPVINVSEERTFSAFPNPIHDELNILLESPLENTKIEIYNLIGVLVYTQRITTQQNFVDFSHYPKGM